MKKYFMWILVCVTLLFCANRTEAEIWQNFQAETTVSEWNAPQEVESCSVVSTKTDTNNVTLANNHSTWCDIDFTAYRANDALTTDIFSPKGTNLPKILKYVDTSIHILSLKNEQLPQEENRKLSAHSCFNDSPRDYYVYSLRRILI